MAILPGRPTTTLLLDGNHVEVHGDSGHNCINRLFERFSGRVRELPGQNVQRSTLPKRRPAFSGQPLVWEVKTKDGG